MQNDQKLNKGLVVVIIVLLIIITALLLKSRTASPENKNQQAVPETVTLDKIENNAVYLGTYQGHTLVFYSHFTYDSYELGRVQANGEYTGSLWNISAKDMFQVSNPKKIFLAEYPIEQITGFFFSNSRKSIYLDIDYGEGTKNYWDKIVNKVFRIDATTFKAEEVWTLDVGSTAEALKYNGAGGSAYISGPAEDNYIVLGIYGCHGCDGGGRFSSEFILNLETRKEKPIKDIGNISFNVSYNSFSYQKLGWFDEPCEPGIGCDENGMTKVPKPVGPTLSELLP